MSERPSTPAQAWAALQEGNARFVSGEMAHPSQDVQRRAELSSSQHPFAVLFGCSDSRVAAEIIFDRGLGDLFVVRTAGHVVDTTVIGSIEYGVDVLGAPLVVVLGHDSCGAIAAASAALTTGNLPDNFVRAVVDRVIPSLVTGAGSPNGSRSDAGDPRSIRLPAPENLQSEHVRATVRMLHSYSATLANAVAEGRCAIVGLEYALADGTAREVEVIGSI
ncbi:carbonic anhydrase [Ruania halotolerans]|uniref:carbonic anhydrase n=1 Tax=Ruania halotolerans TaxID=2897773 RepID=UPI001E31AB4D|nr:carbonic anhydrase [Ruania halotolerans]UFU07454.1 carbonic anhydrase [Ruania halotolerans]